MPEMRFVIRWPDGVVESCYSPSLVVKEFFAPGESYPLADFVERSRTALHIASERVEAKYGQRLLARGGAARADRSRRENVRGFAGSACDRRIIRRIGRPLPMNPDPSRRSPLGRRDRRRPGRIVDQLASDAERHRSRGIREGACRPRVAGRALGFVLSRHAELAVPVAGLSLSRTGPARLHAARRDRRIYGRLRRLVRSAIAGRRHRASAAQRRSAWLYAGNDGRHSFRASRSWSRAAATRSR